MQSGYLSFHSCTIHYLKWGNGKKLLFGFHGYGETASHFGFLADQLRNEFTTVAIDLPFHGETKWTDAAFDGKKLKAIIIALAEQERLSLDIVYLAGFSLGGRIALSLFEEMPHRVKKLVLLAPDGLKLNFWYWFSTQTFIGNKLFRWTMRSPGWFLGMLRIGNKVSIINKSIYKFVEYYIHDKQVRQELYDRWTSMRKCRPDLENIKLHLQENLASVKLLYGKHDRIIVVAPAEKFIDGLKNGELQILDCGHQVLHAKNASAIVQALIN